MDGITGALTLQLEDNQPAVVTGGKEVHCWMRRHDPEAVVLSSERLHRRPALRVPHADGAILARAVGASECREWSEWSGGQLFAGQAGRREYECWLGDCTVSVLVCLRKYCSCLYNNIVSLSKKVIVSICFMIYSCNNALY